MLLQQTLHWQIVHALLLTNNAAIRQSQAVMRSQASLNTQRFSERLTGS